jgi:hypothetical protein
MRHGILSTMAAAVILAGTVCFGAEKPQVGVGLTIYNDNFAVVRENRNMKFQKGQNTVKFTDVASAIDPTSVKFLCISTPGAVTVLEQNYEYDLVNTESLLKRYIDKNVTLKLRASGAETGKEVEGTLMAAMGSDYILKPEQGGLYIINKGGIEGVALKEIPEDLVTKPTLVWLAKAQKDGEQLCQVTYTTGAISWKADYTAVLNEAETALDFSGWVTIDNKSGAGYKDATLKLIAGDVRRIAPAAAPMYRMKAARVMAETAVDETGFAEKSFMEYHMYTLGRKSTINNNQVKQIEFIEPALGAAAKKIFVYEYEGWNWWEAGRSSQPIKGKVNIKIEFENKKENKLGIALPKGKVRVFKKDTADDSLEFVGEDEIDHTPKDEKLSLYIGNAFDIVAERTMTDDKTQWGRRYVTNKIEIRNRKATPVTVFVDEKMPHIDWKIEKTTHKWDKRAAYAARFSVEADVNTPAALEYTVSWPWPY